MDYLDFFSQRLSELRTQKGVSARDMSLSLGPVSYTHLKWEKYTFVHYGRINAPDRRKNIVEK